MGNESDLLFPGVSTTNLLLTGSTGVMNVFVYSHTLVEANSVAWNYIVGRTLTTGSVLLVRFAPDIGVYSGRWRWLASVWSRLGTYGRAIFWIVAIVAISVVPGVVLLTRFPTTNVRFYSYYLGFVLGFTIPALGVLIQRFVHNRRQIESQAE